MIEKIVNFKIPLGLFFDLIVTLTYMVPFYGIYSILCGKLYTLLVVSPFVYGLICYEGITYEYDFFFGQEWNRRRDWNKPIFEFLQFLLGMRHIQRQAPRVCLEHFLAGYSFSIDILPVLEFVVYKCFVLFKLLYKVSFSRLLFFYLNVIILKVKLAALILAFPICWIILYIVFTFTVYMTLLWGMC